MNDVTGYVLFFMDIKTVKGAPILYVSCIIYESIVFFLYCDILIMLSCSLSFIS